jgi:hypothetical protein
VHFRIILFLLLPLLQFSTLTGEGSLSGYESTESDHVKAFSEVNYVLSGRCYLTAEQQEKIAAIVKKIQPEIPILVAQMKKSNIKRLSANLVTCTGLLGSSMPWKQSLLLLVTASAEYMLDWISASLAFSFNLLNLVSIYQVIAKSYAVDHLPQKSQIITLERPGGKKWHPRLHVRPQGRGFMLSTHWPNFVRDNRLRVNDVCLFQPITSERGFRMMVHLLRESRSRTPSLGRDAHGLSSHVKKEVTSAVDAHEKSGRKDTTHFQVPACRKFCILLLCLMKNNPFSPGENNSLSSDRRKRRVMEEHHVLGSDSGGPSKPPLYVVLGGTCLEDRARESRGHQA